MIKKETTSFTKPKSVNSIFYRFHFKYLIEV